MRALRPTRSRSVLLAGVSLLIAALLAGIPSPSRALPDRGPDHPALRDGVDDGLTHVVITLAGDPQPVAPTAAAAERETGRPFSQGRARPLLLTAADQELVDRARAAGFNPTVRLRSESILATSGTTAQQAPATSTPAPAVTDPARAAALPPAPDARVAALEATPGVVLVTRIDTDHVGIDASLTPDELAALPQVADVAAETLSGPAGDPYYGQQWDLPDINWPAAHAVADGTGVVVAVADTGIDFSHPDLAGHAWHNPGETCGNGIDDDHNGFVDDCDGWDFANNDNTPYDTVTADGTHVDNEHATHIAGTIAATADNGVGVAGIAPGVTIMPIKIIENGRFPDYRVGQAIDYAVANGAQIVNLSVATYPDASPSWSVSQAIDRARAAGVLVVAAAGNDGVDIDAHPVWPASYPQDNVVTVGATRSGDYRASFSNWGATSVDLFAPGDPILSTLPGGRYGWYHGTSMAAPHVAAAAALDLQMNPGTSGSALARDLRASAKATTSLAGLSVTGGRLDAAAAAGVTPRLALDVSGLDGFVPDQPGHADLHLTMDADAAPAGTPLGVRATLAYHDPAYDYTYAVLDQPATVTVDGTATDTATDAGGRLELVAPDSGTDLAAVGGVDIGLDTTLPTGRYALLVQVYDPDTGDTVDGGRLVAFTVGDPGPDPTPSPTTSPTTQPTVSPTTSPTASPTTQPTTSPTVEPTSSPTTSPTASPTVEPTSAPTTQPTATPTSQPTSSPTASPTVEPTTSPTVEPTSEPTSPPPTQPTATPTLSPTPQPTASPTVAPTTSPTVAPTTSPTPEPTTSPTTQPTASPTVAPSPAPTDEISLMPNSGPLSGGTVVQITGTGFPSDVFVRFGGGNASISYRSGSLILASTPPHVAGVVDVTLSGAGGAWQRTLPGGFTYTADPVTTPTTSPTMSPTASPTTSPTIEPTPSPSTQPTASPTVEPTASPTTQPTAPPSPPTDPSTGTLGSPRTASNGLRVDAFTRDNPMQLPSDWWTTNGCTASMCTAVRV